MTHYVLAIFLGLGLAASTGLNTSLPLLLLAAAARFHVAGTTLNARFAWLESDAALIVLIVAAALEIVADKFPAVDHALDSVGTFVRPAIGTLAAASVFTGTDPLVATVAGLIVGAPTALGFHAIKAGTRLTSSATTLGCANPLLSMAEDLASVAMSLISIFAPIAVPAMVALVGFALWRIAMRLRRRQQKTVTS
jgi:hypothetical protein